MTLNLSAELGPKFSLNASQPAQALRLTVVAGPLVGQTLTVTQPAVFNLVVGTASSGSGSGSATGTVDVAVTATEPLPAARAVTADGELCQLNTQSLDSYAGITRTAFGTGEAGSVVREGLFTEASWTWTPDVPVYLDANGLLTQVPTAPPVRRVGYAVATDQVMLDPFPTALNPFFFVNLPQLP